MKKHVSTKLTILLCILSIMLFCFGIAACGTKTYKVTLDYNSEQGSVELSPAAENNEYEKGTELTVTVTPSSGYALDTFKLSTEDKNATPDNAGKFVFKVEEDTTITVTFKSTEPTTDKFTLAVPATVENGKIDVSPAADAEGKYDKNTEITVTLTPDADYEVDTFTVGGEDKKAELQNNVYKFNITADTEIAASFKATEKKFTLQKNSPEHGTVAVSPEAEDGKYAENTEITVTLTPAQDYVIDTFTVNGEDMKAELEDNAYTFEITADTTINATFKIVQFTLTVPATVENGKIDVSPAADAEGKYDKNTEITVTLTPDADYEVDTFTVGGEDKKAELQNNVYKFNITADTAITASFKSTYVPVQSVSIVYEKDTLSLEYSETAGAKVKEASLSVKIEPENATYESIEWTTDETTVVTVDNNGKVTAIGVGSDTITVKVDDEEAWISVMVAAHTHNYGESYHSTGDSQHTATCESCDYVLTENHNTQLVSDGESGHHTECTLCEYKTATVEHGELVVSSERSNNNFHYLVCPKGCDYSKTEQHRNEVKTSPTEHWLQCSVCNHEGRHDAHVLQYKLSADGTKHIAYCNENCASSSQKCNYEAEEAEHVALEGFFIKDDDATNHYTKCKDCETLYNPVAHSGSGFTVKDGDADHHYHLCDGCKQAYGEAINHSGTENVQSSEDANHHYTKCADCEALFNPQEHSGTEIVKKNDDEDHHYTKCTDCEALFNPQEHSGSGFTMKEGDADHHYHLCDDCQQAYGTAIAHSGTEHVQKSGDDDHHYTKCKDCETLFDPQEHVLGYTDKDDSVHSVACSVCGKTFPDEPHEIDGAACKCGHQVGTHTLVVDAYGYTDGSCSCGMENLLFTLNSKGTLQLKDGAKEEYFAADIKIILPTSIDGTAITVTGASLKGVAHVTSVIIPTEFTTISSSEFNGCSDLKSVLVFANVTSIGTQMLAKCPNLEWIVLSQTITEIKTVTFGSDSAFTEMPNFKAIYSLRDKATDGKITITGTNAKAKAFLDSATMLYYSKEQGGADQWAWEIDKVLPKPWKED